MKGCLNKELFVFVPHIVASAFLHWEGSCEGASLETRTGTHATCLHIAVVDDWDEGVWVDVVQVVLARFYTFPRSEYQEREELNK